MEKAWAGLGIAMLLLATLEAILSLGGVGVYSILARLDLVVALVFFILAYIRGKK